jgi:uncharacterized protein
VAGESAHPGQVFGNRDDPVNHGQRNRKHPKEHQAHGKKGVPLKLIVSDLQIPIEEDGLEQYLKAASHRLQGDIDTITVVKILSKSLDMRNQEQFYYTVSLVVETGEGYENRKKFPRYVEPVRPVRCAAPGRERPIIVGFGPAGMFAALELIAHGLKPLIFERGKMIEERSLDVRRFMERREINPESNIQFGEGGAGSYSDGKLFSRRNNNTGFASRVLQTFIKFGAPADIGYISKPHLGTDVLCVIVRNIRRYILERGGEIRYGAKMTDLLLSDGRATGIVVNGEEEYGSSAIYLALGHSARETVAMLHARGVAMEQRPIAVGLRIEHPAALINRMRYGDKYCNFKGLGAATYSLNYTNRSTRRGVYTFCMCPGGEVVNASSDQGMMVVNGMSYSRRASAFSNAALVVSCHGEDYGGASPLAGIAFQQDIERRAFHAGGKGWEIPAQNLMDFLGRKETFGLPACSAQQGIVAADMRDIFPAFVIAGLMAAFDRWKDEVPLYISSQAMLLGAETRTSSPVRICRDDRFESVSVKNLFPIGEGAGYAGGITSSAADAIKAVEMRMGREGPKGQAAV